jgi:hypothetical protein
MKKINSTLASIITALFFLSTALPYDAYAAKATKEKGFSQMQPATGSKVFIFNSKRLKWAVYDADGRLIKTGRAVGGKRYCPDVKRGCRTPVGTFRIYHKVGPHFRSSKYPIPTGGALMPWGMFFHKGFAIHGSNDLPNRHASHGCIRVHPSNAKWLNHTLPIGTKVIVK